MSCKWNFHDLRMCIWWQAYHIYFLYRMTPKAGMLRWWSIQKERGASSCHSFHNVKAFALPSQSKRATRISPTKGLYTTMLADNWVLLWLYIINEAYICIHLTRGISRCFVLDWLFEVAKFLHCQNQSVRKRLLYVWTILFTRPLLCTELSMIKTQQYWARHR